jgi:hypothetical protein
VPSLIEDIRRERGALDAVLARVPGARMSEPGVVGEWSVKDVLAHLGIWLARSITMLFQAERNAKLANVHLTRQSWDKANAEDYALQKDRPLERVLADYHETHRQALIRLEQFRDVAALFDTKRYPGLSGQSLAGYVWSTSARHDAEHRLQIETWLSWSASHA